MKISCEVIRDLLPLYQDGVCSYESRIMVEEHLEKCDDCRAEVQAMNVMIPTNHAEQNVKEAEAIKKLSKKWKKSMLKSLLKGVLITIATIVVLALVLYIFIDIKITF